MGNLVRNTIFAMIIATIFNIIVWMVMEAAGVSHAVSNGAGPTVEIVHVVLSSVIASIIGAIGYMILRNMMNRNMLALVGAILAALSLMGPLQGSDSYGTFVSLGVMHILTYAVLAYMLLSDRMNKDAA